MMHIELVYPDYTSTSTQSITTTLSGTFVFMLTMNENPNVFAIFAGSDNSIQIIPMDRVSLATNVAIGTVTPTTRLDTLVATAALAMPTTNMILFAGAASVVGAALNFDTAFMLPGPINAPFLAIYSLSNNTWTNAFVPPCGAGCDVSGSNPNAQWSSLQYLSATAVLWTYCSNNLECFMVQVSLDPSLVGTASLTVLYHIQTTTPIGSLAVVLSGGSETALLMGSYDGSTIQVNDVSTGTSNSNPFSSLSLFQLSLPLSITLQQPIIPLSVCISLSLSLSLTQAPLGILIGTRIIVEIIRFYQYIVVSHVES